MRPTHHRLKVVQGEPLTWYFLYKRAPFGIGDPEPVDLTGYHAHLEIRTKLTDEKLVDITDVSSAQGIINLGADGRVDFEVAPTATAALPYSPDLPPLRWGLSIQEHGRVPRLLIVGDLDVRVSEVR